MAEIILTEPIEAHGVTIDKIKLRKPLGGDIRKHGLPYAASGEGVMAINASAVAKYIEVLGDIPSSSVDRLNPVDFQTCMAKVIDFFGGAQ